MLELLIRPPAGPARTELVRGDELLIGRAPDNDIAIAHPSVSRAHARLQRAGDHYEILDLGSRNGVLLNEQRIEAAAALAPGDQLLLGDVTIEVRGAAASPGVMLGDTSFEMSPGATMILPHDQVPSDLSVSLSIEQETRDRSQPIDAGKLLAFFEEVTHAVIEQRAFEAVLEEIIHHSLEIITEADRACLILIEDGKPVPRVARHRDGRAVAMEISSTVVARVADTRDSVLSFNAQEDRRFATTESIVLQGICSVMCVPLVTEDEVLGVFYVDTLSPLKRFTQAELRIFTVIGNIAAGHIMRQRLLAESIQRRVLEEQMRAAAATQQRLLAVDLPAIAGYTFQLANRPCLAAGGDYVDLLVCQDKVLLALGDVCGKGIGAAILMATLQAAVHAQAHAAPDDVLEIIRNVNRFLYERTQPEKFATLFLGCLEPQSGRLTYVNAGHDWPLIVRHGARQPERLASTGPMVGAFDDTIFHAEAAETRLGTGDLLFVFTDGFHEAESAAGEPFGEEQLVRFIMEHRELEVEKLAVATVDELLRFTGDQEQQDDMTQLLVRRLP